MTFSTRTRYRAPHAHRINDSDADLRALKIRKSQVVRYATLRAEEDALSRTVGSVNWMTDVASHAAAKSRLEAVRDILATFPEEIAQDWRPPAVLLAERQRREARETLAHNIRVWTLEIEGEEWRGIPALEAKLSQPPPPNVTSGVLNVRHDPDAHQRAVDGYYRTLRQQIAAKRSLVAELRQNVADARLKLERLEREEASND